MQITVLQENLVPALQTLKKSIAAKPQLPVLSSILVVAADNEIFFSATDLFIGTRTRVAGTVDKPGSVAILARTLSEVVQSLQPGKITLSLEGTTLTLASEHNKTQLQVFDATEYPPFPEPGKTKLALPVSLLENMEDTIAFAVSKDETRPILNTILMQLGEESHPVATDGFRLAFRKESLPLPETDILFPAKALTEIVKLARQEKVAEITFTLSSELQQVYCQIGETQLYVRLLEGEFPPYQKILPTRFSGQVLVSSDQLSQLLKTAAIFARDSSRIVVFELGQDELTVSATSPALGTQQGTMALKRSQGETIKIAFNVQYILDLVQKFPGVDLTIRHNQPLDPVVFGLDKDEQFIYVVMPFKLQQES